MAVIDLARPPRERIGLFWRQRASLDVGEG